HCDTKPELIFKLEQGEEPWILTRKLPSQAHAEIQKINNMKGRSQENEDKYMRQTLFVNNKTLNKERSKILGEAFNIAIKPVPSIKCGSFGRSLKSISELIISNRSHVRKKSDGFSEYEFFDKKTHIGKKPCGNDQIKKSHSHNEDFIQQWNNSALDQPLQYNKCEKAFNKKRAYVICKRVYTGEKVSEGNESRQAFFQKLKFNTCQKTLRDGKPHESSESGKSSRMKSRLAHQKTYIREKHELSKFGKSFSKSWPPTKLEAPTRAPGTTQWDLRSGKEAPRR
ncbi:RB-associated KRAB zinc finger protein, partial [Galemys pyrenaicus]